ncbi:TPA: hypothetical protein ACJHMI_005485 [Bacillus cereus]
MDLNEALNKKQKTLEQPSDIIYINGALRKDEGGYFRLYPDPIIKFKYVRIKETDVVGSIHQYSIDDLKDAGLTPLLGFTSNDEFNMFQVPVKVGAEIEYITIQNAKVGVQYPLELSNLLNRSLKRKIDSHKSGECGCGGKGSNNKVPVCTDGLSCVSKCQFCNDFGDCHCSSCSCAASGSL